LKLLTALLLKQKAAPIALAPTVPMALRPDRSHVIRAFGVAGAQRQSTRPRRFVVSARSAAAPALICGDRDAQHGHKRRAGTGPRRWANSPPRSSPASTAPAHRDDRNQWTGYTLTRWRGLRACSRAFDAMLAAVRDGLGQILGETAVLVAPRSAAPPPRTATEAPIMKRRRGQT